MTAPTEPLVVLVPDEIGERALVGVPGLRVVRYGGPNELHALGEDAHVLIPGFRPDEDTRHRLQLLPRLRLVQLRSAGAERWIDAVPPNVALSDCRGAHGALTAEWVLAALLSLLRDLPRYTRHQDAGRWQRDHQSDTLIGKRVLLVGAGDVSQRVARRLDGFDLARLTVVGRTARAGVHSRDELRELLPLHNVVVLLVPTTPETVRLAGPRFLAAMPDGGVLVNASRGQVVDTDALMRELRTHRLRAVLDVVDPNPPSKDHPIWDLPGLLITPHIAGIGTRDGWAHRAYDVIRDQLAHVVRGSVPPNLVRDGY